MVINFLMQASEMAHWVKVLAMEPLVLSLVLRTYVLEGGNWSSQNLPSDVHRQAVVSVCAPSLYENFCHEIKGQNGEFSDDIQKSWQIPDVYSHNKMHKS